MNTILTNRLTAQHKNKMKEFIVFYKHSEYGNYTTKVEAKNIVEATKYFWDNYADGTTIYGIMQIN